MPDSSAVLSALHGELQARGLVRRPSINGALPPAFVEPSGGPPAPGEREASESGMTGPATGLVVSLNASELPEGPFDSHRRRVVVAFTYRSRGTDGLRAGRALDAAIRSAIVKRADYGLGILLNAGATPLFVRQAVTYGGLGPVSDLDGVRTERSSYVLEVDA